MGCKRIIYTVSEGKPSICAPASNPCFVVKKGIDMTEEQLPEDCQSRAENFMAPYAATPGSALFDEITAILARSGIEDAPAEAMRILQAAKTSTPANQEWTARAMAERRAGGALLDHAIGHKVFMGISLVVAEGVLVPREETELLGNTALDAICNSGSAMPMVIDMCCGSGNLACAIAHHSPTARVWASDLTDSCVTVTRRNIEHVGVSERVAVVKGDLFAGFAGLELEDSIDVVVCNPPYISQSKLATHRAGLMEHEPREAFDGGPYGLSVQQRVVKEALPFLRPGGTLLLEIGLGQERQAKMLFDRTKEYEDIRLFANSAGEMRVVSGRKRS